MGSRWRRCVLRPRAAQRRALRRWAWNEGQATRRRVRPTRRRIASAAAMEATRTSRTRHSRPPLPLLPSGPGGVHDLAMRGDRCGPPSTGCRAATTARANDDEGTTSAAKSVPPAWDAADVRVGPASVAIPAFHVVESHRERRMRRRWNRIMSPDASALESHREPGRVGGVGAGSNGPAVSSRHWRRSRGHSWPTSGR